MSDVQTDSSDEGSSTVGDQVIPYRLGNFRLIAQHQLEVPPYTKIVKWQSDVTGLKVVWADTPGPVANFWATVCTEVFSSNGTPHTLEHLTFTASKHYPYHGILDAVANRAGTSGTNAWTAQDNTTYTYQSATEEGLLEVMPVFLDHIFFPLLTPEAFTTEVYHVNGKGEEGGVVFSEMQGREGSQGDLLDQSLRQALYNERNAYRSETGGRLDALRKLTLQEIIDYHEAMYVPQNLTVVVAGHAIRPEHLLDTLQRTTERTLVEAGLVTSASRGWVRPFVESSTARNPPLLQHDVLNRVEYADPDESVGMIEISWVGPRVHDWVACAALDTALGYLMDGGSSPAADAFVNIPEAFCSGIDRKVDFRDPNIVTVILGSVPSKHLDTLAPRFINFIKAQCSKGIDMKRMATLLQQQRLEHLQTLETDASSYVQESMLHDILYGAEDGSQFKDVFSDLAVLDKLQAYREDDWLDVLRDWIVERPSATIVARPSAKVIQQQAAHTRAVIAAHRAWLGLAGLLRVAHILNTAKKATQQNLSSKLKSYRIPKLTSIEWLRVDTARSNGVARGRETFSGPLQTKINSEGDDAPYFIQFDHFPSSFVEVAALLNGPPSELFPLLVDTFFYMPVVRGDGTRLSFEQAIRALEELSSDYNAQILGEGILLRILVTKDRYEEAIAWLSDTVYGTQLDDVDRLTNLVNATLQNLPGEKQDAFAVAAAGIKDELISCGSVSYATNIVQRAELYPKLHTRLQTDPQGLVKELQAMQKQFLDPRTMRVKASGDIMSLRTPLSSWLVHFQHVLPFPANELAYILHESDLLTDLGKNPARKAVVYTIPSSESNYLVTYAKSPGWRHADHPAISVACACLSATNSFLWHAVRGSGLAYGCWIKAEADDTRLAFLVYKSPDAYAAFSAGRKAVHKIVTGKTRIEETDLESAKSTLAFNLVASLNSPAAVADESFEDMVMLGRPAHYTALVLKRIQTVTIEDVERVIKTWIAPLFESESSVLGASVTRNHHKKLVRKLTRAGYEVDDRQF